MEEMLDGIVNGHLGKYSWGSILRVESKWGFQKKGEHHWTEMGTQEKGTRVPEVKKSSWGIWNQLMASGPLC